MLYIPIQPLPGQQETAAELAEETSRKIYQLSTTNPGVTTQYYCPWIVHPNQQVAVLCLPEADTMPVALTLEQYDILDSLLQPSVDAGLIPAGTIPEMRQRLEARVQEGILQGTPQQINIFEMLPPFWREQALTFEQIKTMGFINHELITP